jgi:hypothetical protein
MKKNLKSRHKTYIAFNTHLFLPFFMFIVFLWLLIAFFREGGVGFGIVCAIVILLSVFAFLISPLYIIFSYKEIKIVYVLGQTETIRWTDIRSITRFGGFSRHEPLPFYLLSYPKNKKSPFFVNGQIPKTFKTKRLIKKYYKGELYG